MSGFSMLDVAIANSESDEADWAERNELWRQLAEAEKPKRKLRQRNPSPLILNGHGVAMRIENGSLVIRDGFTHHPQQQAKYRFFPRDLDLPTRILLLDGSGTLSFDVLSWLAEQGVALARLKSTGEIATVASGTGYAADPEKVKWQQETRADNAKRLSFASEIIRRKLIASIATIEDRFELSPARECAISKANAGIDRLAQSTISEMSTIFAIEGECAKAYFATWKPVSLHWTGTTRRPIPAEWQCFTSRSSLLSERIPKNRRASHPVNAMLNYAYAVKQAQLQIQTVADGYDPTLGIMHNRHQGSAAYVLDLIEPERPKIDAAILDFVQNRSFAAADFVITRDGVCRLSPQLARMIASIVSSSSSEGAARKPPGRMPSKRSGAKRFATTP
jgi:CRISP-associated protein Cas1